MIGHNDCCIIMLNSGERCDVMEALREAVESARLKVEFAEGEQQSAKSDGHSRTEIHRARSDAMARAKATHRTLTNLLEALL